MIEMNNILSSFLNSKIIMMRHALQLPMNLEVTISEYPFLIPISLELTGNDSCLHIVFTFVG